jgi:Domain of unknown function (DUF5618)
MGENMKEALRHLSNAREISKSSPVEDTTYTDIEPVTEAFGKAYLAVFEAINPEFPEFRQINPYKHRFYAIYSPKYMCLSRHIIEAIFYSKYA